MINPRTDRWHVGKEIPIAVMLTLLAQTAGVVWWAAQVSAKIDTLTAQVMELKSERYTKDDARRDQALVYQRFGEIERRVSVCEEVSIPRRRS